MTSMRKRLDEGDSEFALAFFKDGRKRCCIESDREGWMKCDMSESFLPEQTFKALCLICKAEMRSTLKARNLI